MLGLIRKKELKRMLERLETVERHDCDGSEKKQIWLSGSLEAIYYIAGYFGIKLYRTEKEGMHDED